MIALLFVVSLAGLLIFVIQKRVLKNWIYFIVASIVMVGWPSIQSFSIGGDLASVDKTTERVEQGEATQEQVETLREKVTSLERRPLKAASKLTLARGQAALGDTTKAIASLDEVIKMMPENRQAIGLRDALRR